MPQMKTHGSDEDIFEEAVLSLRNVGKPAAGQSDQQEDVRQYRGKSHLTDTLFLVQAVI